IDAVVGAGAGAGFAAGAVVVVCDGALVVCGVVVVVAVGCGAGFGGGWGAAGFGFWLTGFGAAFTRSTRISTGEPIAIFAERGERDRAEREQHAAAERAIGLVGWWRRRRSRSLDKGLVDARRPLAFGAHSRTTPGGAPGLRQRSCFRPTTRSTAPPSASQT